MAAADALEAEFSAWSAKNDDGSTFALNDVEGTTLALLRVDIDPEVRSPKLSTG